MIRIGFTGDLCPFGRVERSVLKGAQPDSIFDPELIKFFGENDLNVVDLECPLTHGQSRIQKTGPHLKAHPQTVDILKAINCTLAVTANNHLLDYGGDSVEDTWKVLSENNISWIGSGQDDESVSKAYSITKEGLSVGIYNVCENEWSTIEHDGIRCNGLDPVKDHRVITTLKKDHDFVVVVFHGGHEHFPYPSPRMQDLCRFFVDSGADAVVCHHSHIISGMETYKKAPIFYSLGNFCFDWEGKRNDPWNKGLVIRLSFSKGRPVEWEHRFISQMEDEGIVRWANSSENTELEDEFEERSKIILDRKKLEDVFQSHSKKWYPIMDTWIQPYRGKWAQALYKRGWMPSIFSKRKQTLLTNLIRCESHREILLQTLKRNIKS